MTETIDRKPEARKENMFPAFGLSVYERDKMADYSSAWRVVTRIVTDYFFYHEDISLSRIILLSHGESRMIYLSRIIELANCSSHGESRTVTEDFYGMRPLLWTYCTTGRNLRINTHTDGHGESFCPEFANLRIFLHTENCGRSRRIYFSRICELFFTRMVTDGHGGFLWHETFTLDILNNGKEFAN